MSWQAKYILWELCKLFKMSLMFRAGGEGSKGGEWWERASSPEFSLLDGVIPHTVKRKLSLIEINDYVDRLFYLLGENKLKYFPITSKSKF